MVGGRGGMTGGRATTAWPGLIGLLVALAVAGLGPVGCSGYESAYERAVYDAEPVYCYRTLAAIDCWRAPDPRADRRLVNYYGPSPRRAEAPIPADVGLQPPPAQRAGAAAGTSVAKGEGLAAAVAPAADAPRLGGEDPGAGR